MEGEIVAEFKKGCFTLDEQDEVLKKCVTFCTNYNLKPSDLVSCWEVYYLNRQLDESVVRDEEMDGFCQHLQNEQREAVLKEEANLHIYSRKDVDMILYDDDEESKEDILQTPTGKSNTLCSEPFDSSPHMNGTLFSSERLRHVTPFGQRTDKLAVKVSINSMPDTELVKMEDDDELNEDDIIRKVPTPKRCSLVVHESGPQPRCRFMYDRIEDKFNALENRIKRHTTALVASGQYEEPIDPSVASQKSVFTVGMICNEGEGCLNDKSTLLQSSVEHSGGQRVRLELQKLSQFSVFPGQVVGIEGHNPSGHYLIASKVVDAVPLSVSADVNLHPAKKQALDTEIQPTDQSSTREELSVIIASGPFSTTDNFLYEPLTELLAYAKRKLPQLLILLGPFVDSEHPDVKRGTVDRSFDEIFNIEILKRLQGYAEHVGNNTRVLLVPSIRDANHDFVFPQPAFEIHPTDLRHQITSLTNPGIFEANQVKIACCSTDILRHLSGEEMSRNPTSGNPSDRLSRLANHLLRQRSFYPLYPPAEGIPLDFSLSPEALNISVIPDILILPSDMKYFVKVLTLGEGVEGEEQVKYICLNPGRLAKGEGGGTFAELKYFGNPDKINASIIGI